MTNYREGDTIAYKSFGDPRIVKVTARYPDVKNGRPGFDGEVIGGAEDGLSVWGYDSQIIATPGRPDGIHQERA